MADVARILAGFGAITILLAVLKRNTERRCWRKYKRFVHSRLDGIVESGRKLDDVPELWWKTECERLMGFPDGYTRVPHRGKPAADGPRYKALGNSMAVNVMRWIGERIDMVEKMT